MIEYLQLMKHELALTLLVVFLLLGKIGGWFTANDRLVSLVNLLLLINFVAGFFGNETGRLFGGWFVNDPLATLEKNILNLGILLISLFSEDWLKKHRHVPEFYLLLFSTLLGMFFMISSGHFLMFYLGLELSTIPLAALSNFDLEKRQSGEAAVKMILSSAFASAILLFGISLIYGAFGTLDYDRVHSMMLGGSLEVFAFLFFIAGFAFKLSAVPFHLWTADVYEGSPVAVTAFISVISKGAMVFVFSTLLYYVFSGLGEIWYPVLIVLSILTISVGNLFALRQDNLKRFLAFSSISQIGYILIGIAGGTIQGTASSVYFIAVYLFSNLAAFGVISVVSSKTGRESVSGYRGLYKTNPGLGWILALALFSLGGIPPTAGFFGKLFLLTAGAARGNYVVITFAALNLVVSLYYYLRVIRSVFMDDQEAPVQSLKSGVFFKIAMFICVAGILLTGFATGFYEYIYQMSIGK